MSEEQKDNTIAAIQEEAQELSSRQEILEPQSTGNCKIRMTSVMSLLQEVMKPPAESAALVSANEETVNTVKDFQTICNATIIS